ncbi:hypothetical protein [Brachybacterium kimchii]|uniref:Uncharacterized protein n=1 Tax=Brachybacterium kimchii TaxID=2942909 RepID=A0ABY4N4U4_9MICO|nr:hypothetical protein [Brachybacterium kimchii]UQN29579.1 hypothetical protein M4486_18420 [Brachybacterium kimchii]
MATKTKTKTSSAADAAHLSLAEAEDALAAVAAEVAKLEEERDQILADIDAGSVLADVERLAEIDETTIPRKRERLEHLERVKSVAEQSVAAIDLAEFGAQGAGALPVAWEKYQEARAKHEAEILRAAEALKAVTEEWNSSVNSLMGKARRVGLVIGECDPLARTQVQVGTDDERRRNESVKAVLDGVDYQPVDTSRALGNVYRQTDGEVRRHLHEGRERDYLEGQAWR